MTEEYLQISLLTDFIREAQFPSNTVMDLDAWCRDKAYELHNNENFRDITKSEREELLEQIEGLNDDVSDQESTISDLEDDISSRDVIISGLEGDVSDQESTISDLEDDVSSRDATISGLEYEVRELRAIKESVLC